MVHLSYLVKTLDKSTGQGFEQQGAPFRAVLSNFHDSNQGCNELRHPVLANNLESLVESHILFINLTIVWLNFACQKYDHGLESSNI